MMGRAVATAIWGAGLVATTLVALAHRSRPLTAGLLAGLVLVATWLSVIDYRIHRLPNRIVGPLALAVSGAVLTAGVVETDPARSGRALAFGLAMAFVLLLGHLFDGVGMGDVKYVFPTGVAVGWFGWDAVSVMIVATTVAGGLVGALALASGRGRHLKISYGPFISIGTVAGLLTAGWSGP